MPWHPLLSPRRLQAATTALDNDEAGAVVDISGGSLLVFEHEDAAYTAAVAERVKNTYTVVLPGAARGRANYCRTGQIG